MKRAVSRVIFLMLAAMVGAGYGKEGVGHIGDIVTILFDGVNSEKVRELAAYVSQGMDMGFGMKPVNLADKGSSFLNTLRAELGSLEGLGAHREFAHWRMEGGIPEGFLNMLERQRPGCRQRVVELWKEFVATRREAVKQVMHLSGPNADRVAQSIASMMNDIHVLGDHTTKDILGLRPMGNVVRDYIESLDLILGKDNGIAERIKLEVRHIPSTLTHQERAGRILTILERYRGEMCPRIYKVMSRFGFDGYYRRLNYQELRALTKISGTLGASGIQQGTSAAQYLRQRGRVQRVKIGGREITKIDLPVVVDNHELYLRDPYLAKHPDKLNVSTVTKGRTLPTKVYKGAQGVASFIASPLGEGVTAGVLSFAISEGSTIIRYRQGKLEDDQFRFETAFNSGKAVAEGSTICILSSAFAEAPMVLSLGAMIIGGVAVEQAGGLVWRAIDREVGDFPGVTEDELFFGVSDEVKRRRPIWDDGFIDGLEKRTRQGGDPLKKAEDEQLWKKGNPFF